MACHSLAHADAGAVGTAADLISSKAHADSIDVSAVGDVDGGYWC